MQVRLLVGVDLKVPEFQTREFVYDLEVPFLPTPGMKFMLPGGENEGDTDWRYPFVVGTLWYDVKRGLLFCDSPALTAISVDDQNEEAKFLLSCGYREVDSSEEALFVLCGESA